MKIILIVLVSIVFCCMIFLDVAAGIDAYHHGSIGGVVCAIAWAALLTLVPAAFIYERGR